MKFCIIIIEKQTKFSHIRIFNFYTLCVVSMKRTQKKICKIYATIIIIITNTLKNKSRWDQRILSSLSTLFYSSECHLLNLLKFSYRQLQKFSALYMWKIQVLKNVFKYFMKHPYTIIIFMTYVRSFIHVCFYTQKNTTLLWLKCSPHHNRSHISYI